MREYDVYVPTTTAEGTPIPRGAVEKLKEWLANAYGGYTHLDFPFKGLWRTGRKAVVDAVTIVRVLDHHGDSGRIKEFKRLAEAELGQEEVLIIERQVKVV